MQIDFNELGELLRAAKGNQEKPGREFLGPHIVRSQNAGVFFGHIARVDGDTVTMQDSRRVWYWAGAATLSELAISGTKKPNECKFPCKTVGTVVFGVCEIIPMTQSAFDNLSSVPVWTAAE